MRNRQLKTIVDLRINETLQIGAVRKPHLPGAKVRLGNRTYRGKSAVRKPHLPGAKVSIYF